jgi:hypothetical protein
MQISDLVELEEMKDLISEGKVDSATSGVLTLASKYPENQQIRQLVTLVSTHMVPPMETPKPKKQPALSNIVKILGNYRLATLRRNFDPRMTAKPLAQPK